MNRKAIIKNGTVMNPSCGTTRSGKASLTECRVDVRIEDGVIKEIGENLTAAADEVVFDAHDCWITPGFIDIHTHLRDFEQSGAEDIQTGTRAAASGGFTTVLAMANTKPVIDNAMVLHRLLQMIEDKACIKVLPAAAVTKNLAGAELTNMFELSELGAAAFSDDGQPITNLALLRRALQNAALANRVIISHPEDKDLSADGSINESASAMRLGLPGIPTASEAACVAREIEVVRSVGGRLHFAHISAAASIDLIRQAKKQGLFVTADVTPHHLALSDADIVSFDTNFKMNPPLRSKKDVDALIEGITDGTIDAIGTDHAPHPETEKHRCFAEAPFGVIGLETAFPLVYEKLVVSGKVTVTQVIDLFTVKPAAILQIDTPIIEVGEIANIVIIDPNAKWQFDPTNGASKSVNTPFAGMTLQTRIITTLYHGRIVFQMHAESDKRLTFPISKASKL
jgi:dihydroorotase